MLRLGCDFPGRSDRRSLVEHGVQDVHQLPGSHGSFIGSEVPCQGQQKCNSPALLRMARLPYSRNVSHGANFHGFCGKNNNRECLNGQDNDIMSGHAVQLAVRVPGAAACVGMVSPQSLARK